MIAAPMLLILVGDDQVVARMAANDRQQRRYSGLRARLARGAGQENGRKEFCYEQRQQHTL